MRSVRSAIVSRMPKGVRNGLSRRRRWVFELLGSDRYSHPALNQMDVKLAEYLPSTGGFFVEAGANDGFAQSNTYFLERFRDWRGILVEPIPELYHRCVKERPNSVVVNCALASEEHAGTTAKMMYSGLMSLVPGARGSVTADLEHVRQGVHAQRLERTYEVEVPLRTLTSIIDEAGIEKIDLLSLDVEGYELNALKGIDLDRYHPTYMLIEANFRDEIEAYVCQYDYECVDELSPHDVLYRWKPGC